MIRESMTLMWHHCNVFKQPLQWRHNGHDSVSNHQSHDCLLNRIFKRRSKKTSKLRVTGPGSHRGPVNSPHKMPVTRKMFPFDDVIMNAVHQKIIWICHTARHQSLAIKAAVSYILTACGGKTCIRGVYSHRIQSRHVGQCEMTCGKLILQVVN